MSEQKVRNPLTGRMISTTGRLYQQLIANGTIQSNASQPVTPVVPVALVEPVAPIVQSNAISMNEQTEFERVDTQAPKLNRKKRRALQRAVNKINKKKIQKAENIRKRKVLRAKRSIKRIAIPGQEQRITIDRIGETYKRELIFRHAETPEQMFENIQNIIQQTESENPSVKSTVSIVFQNLNDPSIFRHVSLRGTDFQTLDYFMTFLENMQNGNVAGSDAASRSEWILLTDRFTYGKIIYKDTINGLADTIIYEVENVAADRPRKTPAKHYCVRKTFERLGLPLDESLLDDYQKLLATVPHINNNVRTSSFKSSMFKDGVNINGRLYFPLTLDATVGANGEIIPSHFQIDGPSDARVIVDTTPNKMHMDVLAQPVRLKPNLYLDDCWNIVEIDPTTKTVKKAKHSELKRSISEPTEKREDYFLFFDFETHVDWNDANCMKAYSLSTFLCRDETLVALEAADKAGNQDECERIRAEHCKTYIGYDCALRFWDDFFRDSLDKNVHFVSFNGTYFDNMFMLKSFMQWRTENTCEFLIDKELFVNGGILNMRIAKRHDFFDVAKHLLGSLKNLCKGFQVKCCAKRDFDHHEMQKMADEGTLFDFCNSNPKLKEYNEYDVLSLAVIFARYRAALAAIPASMAYAAQLHTIPTIGSLTYKIFTDHVEESYFKEMRTGITGKDHKVYNLPNENNELEELEAQSHRLLPMSRFGSMSIGENKDGLSICMSSHNTIFPKLPQNVYDAILDGKSAGRVQCFQGVTKFNGSIVSYDVCSLYPYTMAVNPEYYPAGNIVETGPGEFRDNKCGFYWINADQSNLQHQNLPLVLPVKDRDHLGNITENNYNSRDGIVLNCCVTHKDVMQLMKYGCKVEILGGFYFTHRIKACDLFRPILDFMQAKNHQDGLKSLKSSSYNAPLRETLKLFMNSLSGKVIEGLHLDKVERANERKLRELAKSYQISCITAVGSTEAYVQYERDTIECISKQRPVYLGAYIYAYARAHMYNYGYSRVGLHNLLYTDTDSIKFPSACVEAYQEATKDLVVPHWPEVLEYDDRYAGHKLFDANSKVFGSFEDELADHPNNVFYCVQKKVWLVAHVGEDGVVTEVKWRGKGFNSRSVMVSDDFKLGSGKEMQYLIQGSCDKVGASDAHVGTNQLALFERLWKERSATLLCSTFKKITRNTRRNVLLSQEDRHQQLFCRVQVCANLKKINIKEIERPICTVLDSEGKICLGV